MAFAVLLGLNVVLVKGGREGMDGAADGQQRGQWTGGGADEHTYFLAAQKLSLKKNLLLMLRLASLANACSGFPSRCTLTFMHHCSQFGSSLQCVASICCCN